MNTHTNALTLATTAQADALHAVLSHVPPPSAEADTLLVASLKTHGQLCPILRRGGQVVDGRRRMTALTALNKEPWVIDLPLEGSGAENPGLLGRSFYELNAVRRELSIGVRAAIADTLATLKKGNNQHSAGNALSRKNAARSMGVSEDTLDRYRRIKGVEDIHQKVLAGTLSLPQAVRTAECRELARRASKAVSPDGDLRTCVDQLASERVSFSVFYADPPWNYGLKEPGTHCAEPGPKESPPEKSAHVALPPKCTA